MVMRVILSQNPHEITQACACYVFSLLGLCRCWLHSIKESIFGALASLTPIVICFWTSTETNLAGTQILPVSTIYEHNSL